MNAVCLESAIKSDGRKKLLVELKNGQDNNKMLKRRKHYDFDDDRVVMDEMQNKIHSVIIFNYKNIK